jgi:hypothetical protein
MRHRLDAFGHQARRAQRGHGAVDLDDFADQHVGALGQARDMV